MAPPESLVGAAAGAVITLGVSLLGSALGNRKNGKDKTPPLGSDVEYLIRRATALKQQQAAALALAGGASKQPGSAGAGKKQQGKGAHKQQGGALGKIAEQAAASGPAGTGPVVTLEHLLTAMKETGAVSKLQGGPADHSGTNGHMPHAAAHPPFQPPPQPEGGLTKKDLEETMKTMLMPPGGGGLQDGESALDRFTTDLTQSARIGKLDPVIGRDDEIRRCIHILSRRTKNNPVLIGESGVGKTAIVEGLAQRIVAGDVPVSLMGVKILELDLGSLTAGCMMPGEFEERLKAVLNEVSQQRGRVILFIDDIHNLVPAAGAAGATMMDGGSLLKPALSRGELRCIGASGVDKFKKTIEKDAALERRFQQVFVDQPSVPTTVSILRGLRSRYENYHGVDISEGALVAAASLSARYINGRFLPDKAIDLMDEATAQVKMESTLKPEVLDQTERRVAQLEMEAASLARKAGGDRTAANCLADVKQQLEAATAERAALRAAWQEKQEQEAAEHGKVTALLRLSMQIERLHAEADEADEEGDSVAAAEMRGRAAELQEELDEKRNMAIAAGMPGTAPPRESNGPFRAGGMYEHDDDYEMGPASALRMAGLFGGSQKRQEVTEADVAKVISRWTGIPVAKLVAGEREKLLSLTDELHRRIIGQHEAVEAVAEAIQRSRADLADPNGPIASFMFLGPTGVGKTELAKALAAYLFNSDEALVRLDMSEYMEKHAVSRLIGAPPGYVGYDEGGLLTDAVRRRPYSVVLFDEIEKAHVDVFNILLQILDDGRVTDTQGHTVSFKNTVIIMTSNLGSSEIYAQLEGEEKEGKAPLSDDERRGIVKEKVMEHVRTHFRPEFVNRVDDFITFEPLRPSQIKQIVVLRAQKLVTRLSERRISLQLEDSAVEYLARVGFDPVFGARPVKRALQRELQTLLAKAVLRSEFEEDDTIIVEAAASAATANGDKPAAAVKKPGDGNYTSGLVLRKGPRRDPAAGSGQQQKQQQGQQQGTTPAAERSAQQKQQPSTASSQEAVGASIGSATTNGGQGESSSSSALTNGHHAATEGRPVWNGPALNGGDAAHVNGHARETSNSASSPVKPGKAAPPMVDGCGPMLTGGDE